MEHHPKSATLALLSQSERSLVEAIMNSVTDLDDPAFTRLAGLRMRNIVEKYSEELKRARLAARSGNPDGAIGVLKDKLSICREALQICNSRLSDGADQD